MAQVFERSEHAARVLGNRIGVGVVEVHGYRPPSREGDRPAPAVYSRKAWTWRAIQRMRVVMARRRSSVSSVARSPLGDGMTECMVCCPVKGWMGQPWPDRDLPIATSTEMARSLARRAC